MSSSLHCSAVQCTSGPCAAGLSPTSPCRRSRRCCAPPSGGILRSVNFLLDKVLSNLAHCGGEPGVVEDTVLLLVCLAESREKCHAVLGNSGLQQLVAVAHRNRPALPAAALRGLVKALVLVGAVREDKAARQEYWG